MGNMKGILKEIQMSKNKTLLLSDNVRVFYLKKWSYGLQTT